MCFTCGQAKSSIIRQQNEAVKAVEQIVNQPVLNNTQPNFINNSFSKSWFGKPKVIPKIK